MGTGGYDWLFWLCAGALATLGLALGAWALFWDRSRGRKRCSRCWYSMEGVPVRRTMPKEAWVCPECGKSLSARGLRRTRRRWRWVPVAALLLLAAHTVMKLPEWMRGDWTALVPTSVLVFIAPAEDPGSLGGALSQAQGLAQRIQSLRAQMNRRPPIDNEDVGFEGFFPWIQQGQTWSGGAAGGTATPTPREMLTLAAWSRLDQGRMSEWQAQFFISRCLADAGLSLLDTVALPDRWLAGEPVPVLALDRGRFPGAPAIRGIKQVLIPGHCVVLPGDKAGAGSIRVPMEMRRSGRVIYRRTFEVPIVLSDRVEDVLEPLALPETTALVRATLDLRVRAGPGVAIVADDHAYADRWCDIDYGIAYRVAVLYEGRVVGTAKGKVPWDYAALKLWTDLTEAEWVADGLEQVVAHPERARLRVTGDPQGVREMYRVQPFKRVRAGAWTGSYEVPVRIDRTGGLTRANGPPAPALHGGGE